MRKMPGSPLTFPQRRSRVTQPNSEQLLASLTDILVFYLSEENCATFLDLLFESWEVGLATFGIPTPGVIMWTIQFTSPDFAPESPGPQNLILDASRTKQSSDTQECDKRCGASLLKQPRAESD